MAAEVPLSSESDSTPPISAINVTPFVDVVLVLLVIFMITAPTLMKDSLGIRLPKAASTEGSKTESLAVAINAQGQILVDGKLSSAEELQLEAAAAVRSNPNIQALIAADENSRHAALVQAIDALKSGGLERFAIQVSRSSNPKNGRDTEPQPPSSVSREKAP